MILRPRTHVEQKAAGLFDEFRRIIHQGAEATRVLDPDGTVLLDRPDDGSGARPEVLRGDLRRILLDSLPDGTVQWGHKLSAVYPLGNGQHELTFADGSTVATSLVVGADGAWSKVRSLVSEVTPTYAGASSIETYLFDADARHPASARAVGGGALYVLSPGKTIVTHREAHGVLHTYAVLTKPQEWLAAIDFANPEAAKARVAAEFDGWAPELTALITESETAPVARSIHALPVGHRWRRVPGVTLLGDAAHLAPPDGEGANLAMYDGAELAKAIATHSDDIEAALIAYEEAMFARSAKAGVEALETFAICFADDHAPRGLIDLLGGPTPPATSTSSPRS